MVGSSKPTTRSGVVKTRASVSASDGEGHGVSVADEETIMMMMDTFCNRIKKVLDVINTLTQFSK